MGLDAGGTALNPTMPRYRMSSADARDLVAYIETLGVQPEPGVSDHSLKIGAILPPRTDASKAVSQAIREVLTAYFAEAAQNPVFGRVVEMHYLELPNKAQDRASAVRAFLEAEHIFALVSGFLADSEKEIGQVLDDRGVPLLNAVSASPAAALNRYVFYLDGGIPSQVEALTTSLLEDRAQSSGRIVFLNSTPGNEALSADSAKSRFQENHWLIDRISVGDSDWLGKLRRTRPDVIMVLTRLDSLKSLASLPQIIFLVPGVFLPPDAAEMQLTSGSRIRAAFPVLPSDFSSDAVAEYGKLAQRYQLPAAGVQAQRTAIIGARILMELLMRVGRDVSRESLIDQLENVREFKTGWSQPLSYSAGRHIGILVPHLIELGKR
jgi:hypothetical protein